MPLFKGNPLTQGHKILSLKTRVLRASHSEDFVILVCTILIQITSVTNRWMPRRWLRRAKHSAVALENAVYWKLTSDKKEQMYCIILNQLRIHICKLGQLTFHVLWALGELLEFLDLRFWRQQSHQHELVLHHNLLEKGGLHDKKQAPYYHYNIEITGT